VIRLRQRPGTFLPTFEQHHLLRASLLGDPARVRESFAQWKSRVDRDAIDHGSLRLLPLLYRNLQRAGVDDPMLSRLKGVYRQVWFRNQLILDQGVRLLDTLAAAGIPTLVLKGAALAGTVYDEPALRPMEDFDLLVPRTHFARAVAATLAAGWSFDPPLADPEPHFVFQHAVGFRRDGGGAVDLHWTAAGLPVNGSEARAVQESSQPHRIGDRETRTLGPADQLLQICTHATRFNPDIPPIRWAADACLLLAREPFPWDTLIALARARGLTLVMHRTLEYLRDGLDADIPEDVMTALARHRLPEWLSLAVRSGSGRLAYLQFVIDWAHHALVDLPGAPRRLRLLPRFLRSYCRVETTGALVRLVTSRLALNTRRR
jgi:hypothetical protein